MISGIDFQHIVKAELRQLIIRITSANFYLIIPFVR